MARFTLPGRLQVVWFATAPASLTAPTAAEITAGTKLVGTSTAEGLSDLEGWQLDPQVIEVPDYVSRQVGTVPGQVKMPISKISIYMDDTARTLYDSILLDAIGAVGFFFDGTATGKESKIYISTCISKERHFERDQGHKATWGFSAAPGVLGHVA